MFSDEVRRRYRSLVMQIDKAITNTIIWEDGGRLSAKAQTWEIKHCFRRLGEANGYRVIASKEPRELLWDMVWIEEDQEGDIVSIPLACEIELIPTQAAINQDFRKLLLCNAAIKVLVCRSEALFDVDPLLNKLARAGHIHEGDLWYIAHFGVPQWAREARMGRTVGFDWEQSLLCEYPNRMQICDGKLKNFYTGKWVQPG